MASHLEGSLIELEDCPTLVFYIKLPKGLLFI